MRNSFGFERVITVEWELKSYMITIFSNVYLWLGLLFAAQPILSSTVIKTTLVSPKSRLTAAQTQA